MLIKREMESGLLKKMKGWNERGEGVIEPKKSESKQEMQNRRENTKS